MKSKIMTGSLGVAALLAAGVVLAEGSAVVTRSTADMEADLMRTYQSPGGKPAGNIRVRSEADAYADLMRDWSAKASTAAGKSVQSRTVSDAYADMMRIWGPVAASEQ